MSIFLKNSAITFITEIFFFLSGFGILIIISRVLGPEGKGIYSLVILIPGMLSVFGSFGIESANVFLTGRKRYKIGEIASNSLVLSVIFGSAAILFFSILYFSGFLQNFISANKIPVSFLWLSVSVIPVLFFLSFFRNLLIGQEKIKEYNLSRLSDNIIQLVLLIFVIFIMNWKLSGAVFSYAATMPISALIVLFLVRKTAKIRFSLNKPLLRDSFKYGIKVYLANIVSFLSYRFDILLVAFFLNPMAVGFYSIAVAIAERMFIVPGALSTALFPRISASNHDEANALTPKVSRHTFFAMVVISFLVAIFARPFIYIFFGSAFLPSVAPLLIILPGIIAFGVGGVLASDLSGRGRPEFAIYSASTCLVSNIALNIFLIPKMGISGAALASTIAYWLDTMVIIFAFFKISKRPMAEFLIIRKEDLKDYLRVVKKIWKR